ncbi:WSC domain-containing protein 2 [Echria macrotheca]|uniref:WSC domain-containing protein 2 n=1 Tax=Echria macrotheca TaxID=438768 RepID=A0AAJ0FBN6_9PEZI|nr:WSC domain-containing protein 2 [Echria macrotheca]
MKFLFCFLLLVAIAASATATTTATTTTDKRDEQQQQLTIYDDAHKSGYVYHGCFNETLGLEGNDGVTRALYGGVNEVLEGTMTVGRCLEFCGKGQGKKYKFAGLEFARECWCAQSLSTLSPRLQDTECNLPCEGNASLACGGRLRLSVYISGASSSIQSSSCGVLGILVLFFGLFLLV